MRSLRQYHHHPLLSIVIPVYRGADCLAELYQRLNSTLNQITPDFEIIMVDDGSPDDSWKKIEALSTQDKRVKGLHFSKNFGQHHAITAGLDVCHGDWVVVMDCDLQDQPEAIIALYQTALTGYEVVLAHRKNRHDSVFKRLFSSLFYRFFNYLSGMTYNGNVANFCLLSRNVVNHLKLMREQVRFFGGLLHWTGYKTATIEVNHGRRYSGKTAYTFSRLCALATEIIIAYSDKPLRLSIKLGFMIAITSLIYGLYIVYQAIFHKISVVGWGSIMASIYFLSGIIITNLGIIGIYLGKTFNETKKRPLYIIAKTTPDFGNNAVN